MAPNQPAPTVPADPDDLRGVLNRRQRRAEEAARRHGKPSPLRSAGAVVVTVKERQDHMQLQSRHRQVITMYNMVLQHLEAMTRHAATLMIDLAAAKGEPHPHSLQVAAPATDLVLPDGAPATDPDALPPDAFPLVDGKDPFDVDPLAIVVTVPAPLLAEVQDPQKQWYLDGGLDQNTETPRLRLRVRWSPRFLMPNGEMVGRMQAMDGHTIGDAPVAVVETDGAPTAGDIDALVAGLSAMAQGQQDTADGGA